MSWTIKGDATVTPTTVSGVVHGMDATARSFEALNLTAATLQFQSLAMDTLKWTATTTNAKGAGTIVPNIGQVVEIFNGATRVFKGHVVAPRAGMTSLAVEVVGPWWWMQEIQLTGDQVDATGATEERVQFEFAAGDLRDMLIALIDRMIALDVPISRGSIAAMGPVTKVTLNNMSCANALTALMSRCPDAVAYFDYSGTTPELKIARRNGAGAMPTLDYEIGVDAVTLDGEGLRARQDLKVGWVRVAYQSRDATTKRAKYNRQTSSGTRSAGEWIMYTTSGPEIVQTLEADREESLTIKTTAGLTNLEVVKRDARLAPLWKEYGLIGFPSNGVSGIAVWSSTSGSYYTAAYFGPATFKKVSTGSTYDMTGKYVVLAVGGTVPEWLIAQYNLVEILQEGFAVGSEDAESSGQWSANFEAWRSASDIQGYGRAGPDPAAGYRYWFATAYSVRVWVTDTSFPVTTTVYKDPKYTFEVPPAGMANFLRESQNWTPWEGSFVVVADDVSGTNLLGRAINLLGTHKDCATMATTVKSLTYDLLRKRATWTLGAPARLDFKTAVGRIQTSAADNIIQV